MNLLLKELIEQISVGLKRNSINSLSDWALNYRVMGSPFPGPWTFTHHPWLEECHKACDRVRGAYLWSRVIGKKGAQIGFTEWALNLALKTIDLDRGNVLYTLPASSPDASDFSNSRFDPAIEGSEHLSNLFTDVANIGHKRSGSANLWIRGSRSRSQMKSLPCDILICDEVDEMIFSHIELAWERMSGRVNKLGLFISTPTIENRGIDYLYKQSTQDHFFFRCPSCSHFIRFLWPESLVITSESDSNPKVLNSHLICHECKGILPHLDKETYLSPKNGAHWQSDYPDKLDKGFHINQLYSLTVAPHEIAIAYLRSLNNPASTQEFWNNKIGETYTAPDARIAPSQIESCLGDYLSKTISPPGGFVTIGVDIGAWIHYEVTQWRFQKAGVATSDLNMLAIARVIEAGKVKEFEGNDGLLGVVLRHNPITIVIDKHPEKRKALEFINLNAIRGRGFLCIYPRGINGKKISRDPIEMTLHVDRTSWMDLALGRFKTNRITLPRDIGTEYKDHISAPVRCFERDTQDNPVARYVTGENTPDHFAHCRTYSEIAFLVACAMVNNQNIEEIF